MEINDTLRFKRELDELKIQYEKTAAHRRKLATQLDTAENQYAQAQTFIQRALPILIQLIRTHDNRSLSKHLDTIKSLVKQSAPVDQLENAVHQLKETAFKTELEKVGKKRVPSRKSALSSLFGRRASDGQAETLSHFREAYMEIVQDLRLNLDKTAVNELTRIENRLENTLQFEDFSIIRSDILQLLRGYISKISEEREQAAAFIVEIGNRLLEVESHLLHSLTTAKESRDARIRFTDTIEKEIDTFQNKVDFTQNLAELKEKVVTSISTIKSAIETSRKDNSTRDTQSDKEVFALKKNLDRMKTEIKSARERSEELEEKLLLDSLTGAYNRRAYDQRIVDELDRYHRYRTIFSVLIMDVDHFKRINDEYGHSVGDLCLKEIINRIRPLLRKTDFLARFGGEEFVAILPETASNGAAEVAEKIRAHIEKTDFLHKKNRVAVTISLGGTEVAESDKKVESIFERVDNALYEAKQSGRNKVVMM